MIIEFENLQEMLDYYNYNCPEISERVESFEDVIRVSGSEYVFKLDEKYYHIDYVCVKLSGNTYENGYIVDTYNVYLNDIDMIENVVLYDDNWLLELAKQSQNNIIEELEDANINNSN